MWRESREPLKWGRTHANTHCVPKTQYKLEHKVSHAYIPTGCSNHSTLDMWK